MPPNAWISRLWQVWIGRSTYAIGKAFVIVTWARSGRILSGRRPSLLAIVRKLRFLNVRPRPATSSAPEAHPSDFASPAWPAGAPPLGVIRSLAYFSPVIEEVLRLRVGPEYFRHLRKRVGVFRPAP